MEENNAYLKEYKTEQATAASVLFRRVYTWMALALVISGLTAMEVADRPGVQSWLFDNPNIFFGMLIGEVVLVVALTALINRISMLVGTLMFILYAVLTGATLSVLFLIYTTKSIAGTFFVTAGTFGAMSLYGMLTRRDLSSWGRILMMGLVGVIIASVVNLFMHSELLYWIETYVGVLLFTALTAYDTQKIKAMLNQYGTEVNDTTQKLALLGALTLYLDFINLFLHLIRIMGKKK